jgi:hypothetical protein
VDFSFFSEEESAESCFEFVLGGEGEWTKGLMSYLIRVGVIFD